MLMRSKEVKLDVEFNDNSERRLKGVQAIRLDLLTRREEALFAFMRMNPALRISATVNFDASMQFDYDENDTRILELAGELALLLGERELHDLEIDFFVSVFKKGKPDIDVIEKFIYGFIDAGFVQVRPLPPLSYWENIQDIYRDSLKVVNAHLGNLTRLNKKRYGKNPSKVK